ncbi:MAG: hypothetical protein IVW52_19790 [Acidimicrobiales bacterium]|nr:hypothetical protein [Acidimicrobiales bacterium]
MSSARLGEVAGSLYGSLLGLVVVLVLAIAALVLAGAALFGYPWETVFAGVIGGVVLAVILRTNSTLVVAEDGLSLYQMGKEVYVPWDNVDRVKAGSFGASLVFKEPQAIGMKPKMHFRFDGFDPSWKGRPTSIAIARQLSRRAVTREA